MTLDFIFEPQYRNPCNAVNTYTCGNCEMEWEEEPALRRCAHPSCQALVCPACDSTCAGCHDLKVRYCEEHLQQCELTREHYCNGCWPDHTRECDTESEYSEVAA